MARQAVAAVVQLLSPAQRALPEARAARAAREPNGTQAMVRAVAAVVVDGVAATPLPMAALGGMAAFTAAVAVAEALGRPLVDLAALVRLASSLSLTHPPQHRKRLSRSTARPQVLGPSLWIGLATRTRFTLLVPVAMVADELARREAGPAAEVVRVFSPPITPCRLLRHFRSGQPAVQRIRPSIARPLSRLMVRPVPQRRQVRAARRQARRFRLEGLNSREALAFCRQRLLLTVAAGVARPA